MNLIVTRLPAKIQSNDLIGRDLFIALHEDNTIQIWQPPSEVGWTQTQSHRETILPVYINSPIVPALRAILGSLRLHKIERGYHYFRCDDADMVYLRLLAEN